ncbi:helix-turn-helix domain-containing protein [Paenibacillus sp. OK076]|uniref:helix-turn-helix domain-containing protein n=1 Tax=Paenibacillus sp. OK076 TaxID=1884379 RepID=UPI0008D5326B|nr:helix-turn-helix domain-containing protein [Paenibacillus sp. OK076]SEO12249.1 Helix-turn-helix domain-containing protein [Paenibacillus sp. OK076]
MDKALTAFEDVIRAIVSEQVIDSENRLRAEFSGLIDKTLDVTKTAAHLGISEKLLYRMCQEGSIPHERYGVSGSRRPVIKFRLSDLEVWRAAQRAVNYKKRSVTP